MGNRSLIGILFVAAGVALGVALVGFVTTKPSSNTNPQVVIAESAQERIVNGIKADSDGDGLFDWEEALWGTNPNNPDSDNDGISDKEEVDARTNPLKEGQTLLSEEPYSAPGGLSTTEALARELFASYTDIRSDGSVSESEVDSAVSDIIARRITLGSDAKQYSAQSLIIEDDVPISAYEGSLKRAVRDATTKVSEYELNTFARAFVDNDTAALKKLEDVASMYDAAREKILTLEVPPELVQEHLAMLNGVSAVTAAVEGLSKWGGDPIDALVLVDTFDQAEQRMKKSVGELYALIAALQKNS